MNQPCLNLGSFFQLFNARKPHLRPYWLRIAETLPTRARGFVFSNPSLPPARPHSMGLFFQPASAHQNWLRSVKASPPSHLGFVFSTVLTPPKLASKRNPRHIPRPRPALIAFSSLPLRKITLPTHPVVSRPKTALCYSISSTGCKLNWAPAFQVTPDRVRSKLLSVAPQPRQTQSSFSSGPKRPSLVNLSHYQTQGSNRRQK
jgi:hypothetical protein